MFKTIAVVVLVAVVAGAGAWVFHEERDNRRHEVARLQVEIGVLRRQLAGTKRDNEALSGRVQAVAKRVRKAQVDLVPLAARVKKSVFTLKATQDEGTGFAAWVDARNTYILTANHVVVLSVDRNELVVSLHRGGKKWLGRIVRTDPDNDLALIRVPARIAPPLWQKATYTPPLAGDELLLAGAPEGYEGSVTSGVVSRVSPIEIQTDASAHPGVSGGPLVDSRGTVVGVMSSGEGENLNFAVPIGRACLRVRQCHPKQRR